VAKEKEKDHILLEKTFLFLKARAVEAGHPQFMNNSHGGTQLTMNPQRTRASTVLPPTMSLFTLISFRETAVC
jgi:hypothetical protein